ncbi:MAG: type II toxin-antitoxin system YafQ family toxin [Eggerthellaceae bacterium]|jgi:mRNA interferase YafQ|nr:type II toxin-antitoxin system YafQ family toxin [Eggerthellaceae bacterium]
MSVKYTVKPTRRFLKDYKLMGRRNLDMSLLDEIIVKLAQGVPLPEGNRDHALTGNYAGHRECHVAPDWLLVYRIEDNILILSLTRTGSHSDLF